MLCTRCPPTQHSSRAATSVRSHAVFSLLLVWVARIVGPCLTVGCVAMAVMDVSTTVANLKDTPSFRDYHKQRSHGMAFYVPANQDV